MRLALLKKRSTKHGWPQQAKAAQKPQRDSRNNFYRWAIPTVHESLLGETESGSAFCSNSCRVLRAIAEGLIPQLLLWEFLPGLLPLLSAL